MYFSRMMGALVVVAGAQVVSAQATHTRPDQIICAMSGSCGGDAASADKQIPIGEEKSFSLVRPDAAKPQARPATSAAASSAPVKRLASNSSVRRTGAVRPATGRMDMRVTFPLGSADLTPGGKEEVQAFATALGSPSLQGMRFNVEGHTDAIGSRDYNVDLSRRRAQSVVDYLVSLGVDRSRLDPQGFGFDKPRAGLAPKNPGNRRVEFVKAG